MTEREIRVGIVGCGQIALRSHAPGFVRVPSVRIAAVMDPDAKRAEALRESVAPEAKVFTDYEAMLDSGLDAVSICTPNHLHCSMTLSALGRGLHVLCEKPIAGTLADADRMLAAATEAGRVLQINQSLRYHRLYATMAALVQQGRVGEVQHVRCIRAGSSPPNKGWSPGADWFVSKAAQGGLLLDIGIHMVDVIRWVAGDIVSVQGDVNARTPGMEVPDNVRALMRHADGATSVLELSWTFPAGASGFEIHGTKGKLQVVPGDPSLELTTFDEQGERVVSHPELIDDPADSYASFARAIHGEIESVTPGELGRDALAICQAIADSSEQGQRVALPTYCYQQTVGA
ncbi:Gfo/Idh/MocA family protein [Phycisphaerales bacterium AB-hyl4]|uniref:Gfo/Idh/MocA family protein n=1 Tax=Natronomicrosphaera hydrolytica TaxID=3242702 RepID=A0ABV4U5B8_9BACT